MAGRVLEWYGRRTSEDVRVRTDSNNARTEDEQKRRKERKKAERRRREKDTH